MLFIQGTGVEGSGWAPQIDAFSSAYTCVWFDNRGIGQSVPRGSASITMTQLAEDALAVLDHHGVQRAHIVGHSLGGCISLELALIAPERVRSLSLLCTAADGPGLVRLGSQMMWRGLRMQVGTRAMRRRAFLEIILTPTEHAALDLEEVAAELAPRFGHDLAMQPTIAFHQIRAMGKWDASARLAPLTGIPTLVVGCDRDLIAVPELTQALAAGIPHATFVMLDDAAHGVPLTQPERINAPLREHLRQAAHPANNT